MFSILILALFFILCDETEVICRYRYADYSVENIISATNNGDGTDGIRSTNHAYGNGMKC